MVTFTYEADETYKIYEAHGNRDAPLLVFLHGGGAGSWMWEKQVRYFTQYRCLVPTLQGHGARSGGTFSIRGCAEELIGLIRLEAGGKAVHLVGFSLGAQIALEILGLAPTLINYAVIDSALVIPMPVMRRLIAPSIRLTHGLTRNRAFSKLQAEQLSIGKEYWESYYADSKRLSADALITILQENMSYEIPRNFSSSEARILVTAGEKEKRIMKQSALTITASHPGAQCLIVPGIGHGFSLAAPDLFNKTVESWFVTGEIPSFLFE
nr:alpha/beta hydrolase [Paenibacillus lutrae]